MIKCQFTQDKHMFTGMDYGNKQDSSAVIKCQSTTDQSMFTGIETSTIPLSPSATSNKNNSCSRHGNQHNSNVLSANVYKSNQSMDVNKKVMCQVM